MDSSSLRRWIEDMRAAEARQRQDASARGPVAAKSIEQALALVAVYGRLHGWPAPHDAISEREDREAYERWHRLHLRLRDSA